MPEKKKHKVAKAVFGFIVGAVVLGVGILGVTNAVVVSQGNARIVDAAQAKDHGADCILVLGASVLPSGAPSKVLQDRLDTAIGLYQSGVAPKIIMSGDNGTYSYNEVLVMKNYVMSKGVPSEDVFCDHAGFSTYESMYRAQNIFGVRRMVVVTQSYHLPRALYAANGLGMDAVGVSSDLRSFEQQALWDAREIPARTKDFFQTAFKVPFALKGDPISLDQSGDITEE